MERQLIKLDLVLTDRSVECLCRYQTLDGFEADRWHRLTDAALIEYAVGVGAETWDETHVAALLDLVYPYINPVTSEQVVTSLVVSV